MPFIRNSKKDLTLMKAVKTRWNSTLAMVTSVMKLDPEQLEASLKEHGSKKMLVNKPSTSDRTAMNKLISSLNGVRQAMEATEGDQTPTITVALPMLLAVIQDLQILKEGGELEYAVKLVDALLESL